MPQLMQDKDGNFFLNTGGGVYHPLTEDQAKLVYRTQDQNPLATAATTAGQAIESLMAGGASLLGGGPEYDQLAQQASQRGQALNMQHGLLSEAAQFAPQAVVGAATAGAGLPYMAGAEALMGAAGNPEHPVTGALIGAGSVVVPELAFAGARIAGQAIKEQAANTGWFSKSSGFEEIPVNPGGMVAGERAPLDAYAPDAVNRRTAAQGPGFRGLNEGDFIEEPFQNPGLGPEQPGPMQPPDPLALLRAKVAAQDTAEQATPRGRTAAQAPRGGGGLDEGDFVEGAPFVGPPAPEVPTPSPSANPPGAPPNPAPRMAERVTSALDDAAPGPGGTRVYYGHLTPEQLYDLGVPTSAGQRAQLNATVEANDLPDALAALGKEQSTRSNPLMGGPLNKIAAAQQEAATNFIGRQLGIPAGMALTDPLISRTAQTLGHRFDAIAEQMGGVPITQEIRDSIDNVLEHTTGGHKGQLTAYADEIVKRAERNGGELSGQDWMLMRSKIMEMMEHAPGQSKADKGYDAGRLVGVLTQAMEAGLPQTARAELADLRHKWQVALTVTKPGAKNPNGQINPTTFYNNWRRPQGLKSRGLDEVGQFMSTMTTLTSKQGPDSGTAKHLLSQLTSIGLDNIPGGGIIKKVTGL